MKQLLLLAGILLATTATGYSQIGYGVEVGLNAGDYHVKLNGDTKKTDFKLGGRVGVIAGIPLNEDFVFQPGLLYVTNGYRADLPGAAGSYERYRVNTIELPLNVQHAFGDEDEAHLFAGAGPYVAYNRNGQYHIHSGTVNSDRALKMGTWPTDDIKQMDIGVGVNGGYRLASGLFVRLKAQLGLRNLWPDEKADVKLRNFGFCISGGYWFR
jgi:hypothetical protein